MAFRSIAKSVDPERSFKVDELIAAGAIATETFALFNYLLQLLVRFGAVSETEDGWRLAGDNDLPEFAEVWRLLLAEAPELVAELALVAAIAEELPGLLANGLRQPEPSPLPMLEHLLHASPVSATGLDVVRAALTEIGKGW